MAESHSQLLSSLKSAVTILTERMGSGEGREDMHRQSCMWQVSQIDKFSDKTKGCCGRQKLLGETVVSPCVCMCI